jgi:hypothetical protein
MYGSHHKQPQNHGQNDVLDPFLVVKEPSVMHAIHGQHSYRPDPTKHVITGAELVLLRVRTSTMGLGNRSNAIHEGQASQRKTLPFLRPTTGLAHAVTLKIKSRNRIFGRGTITHRASGGRIWNMRHL